MTLISSRSCGFYIRSERISGNDWGPTFIDNTYEYCDSNYNFQFDCTNTTYKDADGNAEGDTIFVKTDCWTNQRFPDGQDPRYNLQYAPFLSASLFDPIIGGTFQKHDPQSNKTCTRGCYCGYHRGIHDIEQPDPSRWPYQACDFCPTGVCPYCVNKILNDFIEHTADFYNPNPLAVPDLITDIPLTSQNITLLKFYGAIPCDASGTQGVLDASKVTNPSFPWHNRSLLNFTWRLVPDGDVTVYRNPYDCFGNLSSNAPVMHNYANNYATDEYIYNDSTCEDDLVENDLV